MALGLLQEGLGRLQEGDGLAATGVAEDEHGPQQFAEAGGDFCPRREVGEAVVRLSALFQAGEVFEEEAVDEDVATADLAEEDAAGHGVEEFCGAPR